MTCEFERTTVGCEALFEGPGIHSGKPCRVVVSPWDDGIVFSHEGGVIRATPESVTDTPRSTILGGLRTVEHLMSALAGAEITDAHVDVQGDELPILGGGSAEYFAGLTSTAVRNLGRKRAVTLFGRVNVQESEQTLHISVGDGRWRYVFDPGDRFPGLQSFEVKLTPETYASEIAPARTFAFEQEIDALRDSGLGLGGDERNTLVLGVDGYRTPATWADEPARHKLLDCIGDIALSGVPVRFLNVVAERSGHALNVRAAARLSEICKWED